MDILARRWCRLPRPSVTGRSISARAARVKSEIHDATSNLTGAAQQPTIQQLRQFAQCLVPDSLLPILPADFENFT